MNVAIGTTVRTLPRIVRFGIDDYSPRYRPPGVNGMPEGVVMSVVVVPDHPFGRIARWWLTRRGWPVELVDDRGTRMVTAEVRFIR